MNNFNPKYDDNKKDGKIYIYGKNIKKMVIIIEKLKLFVILVKHTQRHSIILNNKQ